MQLHQKWKKLKKEHHSQQHEFAFEHQDQVIEPPADARVVGSTPFCKYAALAYGDSALTIQPHPEFSAGYMRDLIEARRDVLPEEVAERGLASVDPDNDSAKFAEWVKAFLRATQTASRR